MIKYYDREISQIEEETEYGKKALKFLYHTALGRFCLKAFAARPFFSRLQSVWKKSRFSVREIKPFTQKYNIRISDEEIRQFKSFNDFFIRPHPPIPYKNENELTAPADSKMSFFKITDDLKINVKNSQYTVSELLGSSEIAKNFRNGTCIIYRLSADYNHHYYYIDDGKLLYKRKIQGELHTIRPISEICNVFSRNSREVSLQDTAHLGIIAQIEVGALLVGKIQNYDKSQFVKNEEKGFFEFGGSTIIILLNKEIQFDEDIEKMNLAGYETKVSAGERVGTIC